MVGYIYEGLQVEVPFAKKNHILDGDDAIQSHIICA